MLSKKYENILENIRKNLNSSDFKKSLERVQKIDLNHYDKIIQLDKMNEIVNAFKTKKEEHPDLEKILVLQVGNPEIVFMTMLEGIRQNVKIEICIEDFCLAQNLLILELVNSSLNENMFKMSNLLSDNQIIEKATKFNKVICISNSNLYYRLDKKIKNIFLYPYNTIEIYFETDEYEELLNSIMNYASMNRFEIDIYEDMKLDSAVNAINRDGMKFASLLLSKNKESKEYFKNNIKNTYYINENPFNKKDFELKLN